ncbi:hypothetical protein ACLPJK_26545 [Pseudomonas aeruginosa]|uniref:hypothetical protein n=1 Tax=Pseudomonas aeruginosa TaxID=287 RepID=UPI003D2C4E58
MSKNNQRSVLSIAFHGLGVRFDDVVVVEGRNVTSNKSPFIHLDADPIKNKKPRLLHTGHPAIRRALEQGSVKLTIQRFGSPEPALDEKSDQLIKVARVTQLALPQFVFHLDRLDRGWRISYSTAFVRDMSNITHIELLTLN